MDDKLKKEIKKYVWEIIMHTNHKNKLPSETQIAIKFDVNRSFIHTIFKEFESINLITSLPKKGYFISKHLKFITTHNYFSDSSIYKNCKLTYLAKMPKDAIEKIKVVWGEKVIDKFNFNDYEIFKKVYLNNEAEIINCNYIMIKKVINHNNAFSLDLIDSSVNFLKKHKNAIMSLNSTIGDSLFIWKKSVFINFEESVVGVIFSRIKPNYFKEDYIKRIR